VFDKVPVILTVPVPVKSIQCALAVAPISASPINVTVLGDDTVTTTVVVVPASIVAVIVTPFVAATKPPPAVPPVAIVVSLPQVTLTFIAMAVLPFATNISEAPRLAHVNHDPEPFAALFHWLTESMFTDEF
jgi:hypothetical protein